MHIFDVHVYCTEMFFIFSFEVVTFGFAMNFENVEF